MSHPEAAGAPPQRHRRHFLVAAGAALTMTGGQFVFLSSSFVNPPLAKSLGTGLSQVMVYNSLTSVSGVLAMTFLAPMLFRTLGVRKVMIALGLWAVASLGAVTFVSSLAMLYVLGFALGLVFGLVTMMSASLLVNTWFEQSRGAVMGAVFAFSGLGGILAGLVLPAVVTSGGWERGFTLLAGVVLVLTVGSALFLVRSTPADVGLRPFGAAPDAPVHPGTSAPVEIPGVPAPAAFRSAQFAALVAGIVLFGVVQAVQQHFAPMVAERGVTIAVAGTILSLMALSTVVTNLVLGTLNDRRGTAAAVTLAVGSQVVSMAGFALAAGFVPLAASTVVFAFAVAFPGVLIPILVMLLFGPRDFGTLLGPTMAAMPAGMAVGAPLWGMVHDAAGTYTPMLIASAAVSVVIVLLLVWAIRTAPGLRARFERGPGDLPAPPA